MGMQNVMVKGNLVEIYRTEESSHKVMFEGGRCAYFKESEVIEEYKTYEDGLNDAWELAKKINHMCLTEMKKCFGSDAPDKYNADNDIFNDFTPQEALAKMKAYEEEKEIKVGDVVTQDGITKKLVVGIGGNSGLLFLIGENGEIMTRRDPSLYRKTGKHIDIQKFLDEIGKE